MTPDGCDVCVVKFKHAVAANSGFCLQPAMYFEENEIANGVEWLRGALVQSKLGALIFEAGGAELEARGKG